SARASGDAPEAAMPLSESQVYLNRSRVLQPAVAESTSTTLSGGENTRQQMLRVPRSLFSVAAVALVAIAATIGATYSEHERTAATIAESRELARPPPATPPPARLA